MYLTLTSDLLVRDEYLRWKTSLDEKALCSLSENFSEVTVKPLVQEETTIRGFNGTSQLRRLPAQGVRRGSVFKVTGEGIKKIKEMLEHNIWLGERTNEGFGRFRLDSELPGVGTATLLPISIPKDDPLEQIAKETLEWLKEHPELAKIATQRKPSLSQWFDFVSDLKKNPSEAIPSRQFPSTEGGKNWCDKDAKEILEKIQEKPEEERELYASMFLRWLRSDMRGRS
jgi:hypothetical protein